MFPSATPSSQTSSGIGGFPFMFGQGHKNNGVAFVPNTSSWSSSTPITCGTPYHSRFGSPVAAPFVFMSDNKKGDSFASNHLATSTFTSSGTSSRPLYRPTPYDGPVSTSGGYRATSNVEKLVSISAMPDYNTISHEELRLEDYMTGKPSQTSSGIGGFSFMAGQGHKNGVAFVPNTSSWSSSTPITCGTPHHSGFGSPVATPFVFKSDNKNGDSFASNHLATSTFTSSETSSRPSYRPTLYDGPVSTSGGYRATSNVEKLVSISAMPAYNTLSHEELRLEDYMTGKRGLGTNSSEVKSTSFGVPRCSSSPANESYTIPFPKATSPSVKIYPCGHAEAELLANFSRINSFKPWSYNPFGNPSTSPATQSSFSSFSNPTFPLFTRDPKNAHVNDEPSPIINKPTTLVSPCVPSTQKCDEEVTRVIGQSSADQLSSSHTTSTSSLANPFGTLSPSPQLSFECSRPTPIQYGISSIPVKDKPAPVKYPLPTTRHISRGCKLPARKYDPKSSVPFFLSEL